ncbi:hypothetical protein ACPEEZ_07465 [Frigoribacterium sp. 2-23]|uniref:hypothetical protein n=1 Tax=Frigoribacterium sp. 2-23 TaxID=3415006 RepID=UPI003C6FDD72
MAIGVEHPSCFSIEKRLFVVPSWSPYGVAETRQSWIDARGTALPDRGVRPLRSIVIGALGGGLVLATTAITTWGVGDVLEAAMLFVVGSAVGAVLALGVRTLVATEKRGRVTRAAAPLPAVEIPLDVARAAPDDSSDDELILWATRVVRFRYLQEAMATRSRLSGARSATPGSLDPSEEEPLSSEAYRSAQADYEPVARLLGLTLP